MTSRYEISIATFGLISFSVYSQHLSSCFAPLSFVCSDVLLASTHATGIKIFARLNQRDVASSHHMGCFDVLLMRMPKLLFCVWCLLLFALGSRECEFTIGMDFDQLDVC